MRLGRRQHCTAKLCTCIPMSAHWPLYRAIRPRDTHRYLLERIFNHTTFNTFRLVQWGCLALQEWPTTAASG